MGSLPSVGTRTKATVTSHRLFLGRCVVYIDPHLGTTNVANHFIGGIAYAHCTAVEVVIFEQTNDGIGKGEIDDQRVCLRPTRTINVRISRVITRH